MLRHALAFSPQTRHPTPFSLYFSLSPTPPLSHTQTNSLSLTHTDIHAQGGVRRKEGVKRMPSRRRPSAITATARSTSSTGCKPLEAVSSEAVGCGLWAVVCGLWAVGCALRG